MSAHLFLIANAAGFGEINLGLRLAAALHARGDRVEFLAPRDAGVLLAPTPFAHRPIDQWFWDLERRVPALVAQEKFESVVLVDVTSVLLALAALCVDTSFLQKTPVPIVGLDFWDLRRAGAEWDLGSETWPLPAEIALVERRLVPSPLAAPDTEGAFAALPEITSGKGARAGERAALGLGDEDRLVLFTSSRFQQPELQVRKAGQRLARLLPELFAEPLGALGARVSLAHVGPAPLASWAAALGPRYRFLGQLDAARFHALLRAADLVLSFNTTGSTTMAAVAAGVPVVAGMNSRRLRSLDEAEAESVLGHAPSPRLREWLGQVVPLHPFHVWGLGLFDFLQPVLAGNPYGRAFRSVEVLDGDALVDTCRGLLFDAAARAELQEAQAAYRDALRGLPGPAAAFDQALSST